MPSAVGYGVCGQSAFFPLVAFKRNAPCFRISVFRDCYVQTGFGTASEILRRQHEGKCGIRHRKCPFRRQTGPFPIFNIVYTVSSDAGQGYSRNRSLFAECFSLPESYGGKCVVESELYCSFSLHVTCRKKVNLFLCPAFG